jgi:fumarate hydratase class II
VLLRFRDSQNWRLANRRLKLTLTEKILAVHTDKKRVNPDEFVNVKVDLVLSNDTTADEKKCKEYFDESPTITTAFLPLIGYERATDLIKEFFSNEERNMRLFLEKKLGIEIVNRTLSPYKLTALGYRNYKQDAEGK